MVISVDPLGFEFCSVKLVEQELWQKEEKGLIGILPVRDSAENVSVSSVIAQGIDIGDIN